MNVTLLFSNLGLSSKSSQDIMLVLFVALVSFVYGMLIGKYRLMTVLINTYVSFAIISVVPHKIFPDYTMELLAFFIILILLTVFNKRFFDLSFTGSGSSFLWRVFSMSFLQIVLLLSITFSITPKKVALTYVSSTAYAYLTKGWSPLVWMALPLVYMYFIYKKVR